ncbi:MULTISPECIES: CsxC family protein [Bacillaceae]|uniref:DUF3794 domain-containing protein n=1 Tax=Evansella alkalicola TaxID=745819 RepID=A0ABS6JYD6_9BACI|nr:MULTISPECIES: DUF3794 domain-containing protein [Bacillaceae]MBU9723602.1 DUF3794 domain-containing protein [Bacillus alkalicola]
MSKYKRDHCFDKHKRKSVPPPPFFAGKVGKKRPKAEKIEKEIIKKPLKKPVTKPKVHHEDTHVKVPVVLGEENVQIDLTTKINFPDPVLEIKDIKKNIKVTQCRLLLPTKKLFLKGFIRKNIQYATPVEGSKKQVVSDIRSLTIDVPFEKVVEVKYENKPIFSTHPQDSEFTFFTKSPLPDGFSSKDDLLSADLSEFDQISGEEFNELPKCQLISSRFIEYDESLDRKMGRVISKGGKEIEAPFEEGTFRTMEEKMVVELRIKILQKQQIDVASRKRR